jgi:hypothetical protein
MSWGKIMRDDQRFMISKCILLSRMTNQVHGPEPMFRETLLSCKLINPCCWEFDKFFVGFVGAICYPHKSSGSLYS